MSKQSGDFQSMTESKRSLKTLNYHFQSPTKQYEEIK